MAKSVNQKTNMAKSVNPKKTTKSVNPKIMAKSINPKNMAKSVNPKIMAKSVNPKNTANVQGRANVVRHNKLLFEGVSGEETVNQQATKKDGDPAGPGLVWQQYRRGKCLCWKQVAVAMPKAKAAAAKVTTVAVSMPNANAAAAKVTTVGIVSMPNARATVAPTPAMFHPSPRLVPWTNTLPMWENMFVGRVTDIAYSRSSHDILSIFCFLSNALGDSLIYRRL